jgi:phosphotransferase system IIB component
VRGVEEAVASVGGASKVNLLSETQCATRLRFE